jgi:hypothetical protein
LLYLILPLPEPVASRAFTILMESSSATSPKTTWRPSSQLVLTVVTKNCEPLLLSSAISVLRKFQRGSGSDIRVGAGVGHGEKTRADMLLDEVLIGELLAVDGLATGALFELASKLRRRTGVWISAHVAAGKVTTLEHEIGNDAVERRALVAEAVLAGAQLTEVAGGLGDDVIVESEGDAAALLCFVRLAMEFDGAGEGETGGAEF